MKQPTKYTLHPGPNLKYADLYLFLYTKVKEMRGERQAINHNLLIAIALEEQPELRDLALQGQRAVIDRFMKFCNLNLRSITSTNAIYDQQMDPEEAQTIENFKTEYIRTTILEEDIFNMDQSGLNFEIPQKKNN